MPQTPDGTQYDFYPSQRQTQNLKEDPEKDPKRDKTTTLVLIHGLGLTRDLWHPYIDPLRAQYNLLTYDLYGHGMGGHGRGGGSYPTGGDLRQPLTLKRFAEQTIKLCHHLGIDKAVMIGFSLGGMINRRIALDKPDLVTGLVILNAPHKRPKDAQKNLEKRAESVAKDGIDASISATLTRWFTPDFIRSHPQTIAQIKQTLLANDTHAYADAMRVLAQGVFELDPLDRTIKAPIQAPSLVMTCTHDSGSTPAMSHAIAATLINAQTTIIPDLKHMGLIERPDIFLIPLLNFLKKF